MNAQQAAHWRMLATAHKDATGDLAEAYRVIGALLCYLLLLWLAARRVRKISKEQTRSITER